MPYSFRASYLYEFRLQPIELLLEFNANINIDDNAWFSLCNGAKGDDGIKIISLLVNANIDLNRKNEFGDNCLEVAKAQADEAKQKFGYDYSDFFRQFEIIQARAK